MRDVYANSLVTHIVVPSGVETLVSAFCGYCSGLKVCSLPSICIEVPDNENIQIGIGANLFNNCTSLVSLFLPDGWVNKFYQIFQNCFALTTFVIPSSVDMLSDYEFDECTNLAEITIQNGLTSIELAVFEDCSGIVSMIILSSVTSIARSAFLGCSFMTVTFETTIWWSVFDLGSNESTLSSSDLANTSTSATYLTTTYTGYTWLRS